MKESDILRRQKETFIIDQDLPLCLKCCIEYLGKVNAANSWKGQKIDV